MVLTAITLEITPCPLWASPGGSHLAMHQNHLCCFKIPDAWFLLQAQWASALSERKGPGKSISHIWFWCQFVIVKMCLFFCPFFLWSIIIFITIQNSDSCCLVHKSLRGTRDLDRWLMMNIQCFRRVKCLFDTKFPFKEPYDAKKQFY